MKCFDDTLKINSKEEFIEYYGEDYFKYCITCFDKCYYHCNEYDVSCHYFDECYYKALEDGIATKSELDNFFDGIYEIAKRLYKKLNNNNAYYSYFLFKNYYK